MDTGNNQKRILIVDDEVDLANLFKAKFEANGFAVTCCVDGEVALQTARDFKPDLIMLDLMMPRLSGFDAIDLFHSTTETSAASIVIFSALNQPEDIAKAKQLGVDDYIVKSSTSFDEVVARIHAIMNVPLPSTTAASDTANSEK